ncbi:MAG: DNA repair protein RecO, partial [Deltaproteobacteria bacterium]|nr:DNA repair protein RecO [Deltaproteobacteria bacterium]
SESFILKKTIYGEADFILTIFTKDYGKITGFAKNAKRSSKRFGGRLEPFMHLRISFRERSGRMNFVEDCETIRVFYSFMQNVDLFALGSFIMENIEILVPKEEPNERTFSLLVDTLSCLDSKRPALPELLRFQLSVLQLSGLMPSLNSCAGCGQVYENGAVFSIKKGGVICSKCNLSKTNGIVISRDFLLDSQLIDKDHGMVFKYINLLRKFTEYHTGREFKSFKLVEELCK